MMLKKKKRRVYFRPAVEALSLKASLNLLLPSSVTLDQEIPEGDDDTFLPVA